MKKIIILLVIGLFSFSCDQNEKTVEVINVDFRDYNTYKDLSRGDAPPAPIEDKKGNNGIRNILLNKVKANPKYDKLFEDFSDGKSAADNSYHYLILVNESGIPDKIIIEKSMGEELDNIVINEVSGWKFKPALIKGTNVKFKYDLQFNGSDYFVSVEEMPEPIGGLQGISKLVHYPEIAKRAGIEGRVYIKAFVNEHGEVDSVKLIKGIGAGCDENAMEAVKQTKFKPGMDGGQNVKTQVVVPILYKLK